jgi:indolepyruvate ferredoxin oxidoreductase alpha subunit
MSDMVLLGDEAVSVGALHAGISAAYAYPGTPSTEIMEYLVRHAKKNKDIIAHWSANEKTALEEVLGTSVAGKRAITSMKHVGLNVAADPFMNAAICNTNGGVVIAVADDPGMHSSQNEQDTRYYADFAHVMAMEPANQQEAYEMTIDAFDISEKFGIPVLMRLVTRLAHSRAVVKTGEKKKQNDLKKAPDASTGWNLLPPNARKLWKNLFEQQKEMQAFSNDSKYNPLVMNDSNKEVGVITTGIARNYYKEVAGELKDQPSHLHIGVYPAPEDKIRKLAAHCKKIIIIEEGYPLVERKLRGILPQDIEINGKLDNHLPPTGEMNPEIIKKALGLEAKPGLSISNFDLPNRPPQLCKGCPHIDSYDMINKAMEKYEKSTSLVTSDIGCYTLGAYPPYNAIETCVCMGASVSMAKGAAEAGLYPVVGVLGDSTFFHSGSNPLLDAIANDTNMTLVILDNEITAMTGAQPTIVPSSRIESLVKGLGVDPEHLKVMRAFPKDTPENTKVFEKELEHKGLSVVIMVRECIEVTKKNNRKG